MPHSTGKNASSPVNKQTRAWQRMLSGRRLDLLNPSPLDIEISDIAHGLARVARWNGQTLGPCAFSVAQHSLIVEDITRDLEPGLDPRWRLAALVHDSAEYVIGDLISPFKAAIGFDYKAFELRLLEAIHMRVGIPPVLPDPIKTLIKRADGVAAYYEATRLAGFSEEEGKKLFGTPKGLNKTLQNRLSDLAPLPSDLAQGEFLKRFEELSGEI